ncbi:MAG: thermonuclease family protein [Proteobacteria bacterium]|nr:thermonuclease family protein [Pseudomonadota bacterium]
MIILLVCLIIPSAEAGEVSGKARVIDGDTIEVAGQRIDLYGIDAPELTQTCRWPNNEIPCGNISRTALLDLVATTPVVCSRRLRKGDGSWVAICTADGFDVGRNMVHTGWALAISGQSKAYAATEKTARKGKRGLWRGQFVPPWEWRRQQ